MHPFLLFMLCTIFWVNLFVAQINNVYRSLFYNVSSSIMLIYHHFHPAYFVKTSEGGIDGTSLIFMITFNGILYNGLDAIRLLESNEKNRWAFIGHHLGCIACIATSLMNANYQEMYKFYLLLEVSSIIYNARLTWPDKNWIRLLNKASYLSLRPLCLYVGFVTLLEEIPRYPDDYYSTILYIFGYISIAAITTMGIKIALFG